MRHSVSAATTILAMAVAFVVNGQEASKGKADGVDAKSKVITAIVNSMPDDVRLDQPALENSAKEI
ncbi:MAG: hypothetical protein GXP25_10165, partial [Planctomycetes bacterium]|nr:hypothetical protein [Planctomycetota bacterium]